MIEKLVENRTKKIWVAQFNTIGEFSNFITKNPTNKTFKHVKNLDSTLEDEYSMKFTETSNFDEAINLLANGWSNKANEINHKLKASKMDATFKKQIANVLDVAGYQPIVPLFLTGQPACMVNRKQKLIKQKILTLVKPINYPGYVSSSKWTEEGIKALQIVRSLEANGYRVNVDIVRAGYGDYNNRYGVCCRVRVKHSNERLNISKLAFTMCHPSMQRRLMFRFTETYDKVNEDFRYSYGHPFSCKSDFDLVTNPKNEFVLPLFFDKSFDASKVSNMEELRRMA